MWIMLNDAFVSAVEDRDDPRLLVVRARCKGDITRAFRGRAIEIASGATADYAYRTWVSRKALKRALADAIERIDYDNFKDSVDEQDRHDAYLDVWSAMYRLQTDRQPKRRTAWLKDLLPRGGGYAYDGPALDDAEDMRDFMAQHGFALNAGGGSFAAGTD